MPQIRILVSPEALRKARVENNSVGLRNVIFNLDKAMTELVHELWEVPRDDIACSADVLFYTRGEADFQIEIRYTSGEDEYHRGKPFAPTKHEREALIAGINASMRHWLGGPESLTHSVWVEPVHDSSFVGPM